jgi:hypothetical protein
MKGMNHSQGCHPARLATPSVNMLALTNKDLCQILWIPSFLYQLIDSIFHTQIRPQFLPDLAENAVGFLDST